MRRAAEQYGYLRSNEQMRVMNTGAAVEIMPVNPSLIYVPVYDPYVVYAPPRPGFFLGAAIGFGPCYSIGAFSGWGWGGGFNWYNHAVFVNHEVWGRTWYNRGAYIHNYGNWDRGAWRNGYSPRNVTIVNNRTTYRNENVYSNYRGGNGYNRGGQTSYGQSGYSNNGGRYNRGMPWPRAGIMGGMRTRTMEVITGTRSRLQSRLLPAIRDGAFMTAVITEAHRQHR